jgi:hypothetical protein
MFNDRLTAIEFIRRNREMTLTIAPTSTTGSNQTGAYSDAPAADVSGAGAGGGTAPSTSTSAAASATAPPTANRLTSDSPLFRDEGVLLAGRPQTFPTDAFVDTTTSNASLNPLTWGSYTYSREAQLRKTEGNVSVAADVRVTRSSDGTTLNVQSNVRYQDTSGKPIARVYITETPLVDGQRATGGGWSGGVSGTAGSAPGGGVTGGSTWSNDNTVGGTVSRQVNTDGRSSGGRPTNYAADINDRSSDLRYKVSVTIVYKDGTSAGPVELAARTSVR